LLSDFGNQYIVIGNWIQQAPGPPVLMMQEDDHVMEEVPSHEEKGVERGERHPPQPFPPVGHPKNKTNTGAEPFQHKPLGWQAGKRQENSLASKNQVLAKLALLVIGLSGAHRLKGT